MNLPQLSNNLRYLVLLVLLGGGGLFWHARRADTRESPLALARDVPRGALVYVQVENLPALVRQWDESALKRDYLSSANYSQFKNRHLALKLLQRWEEFNQALGFSLDLSVITGAADNRAALAIYDIGRLDFVLIAPLNAEKAAATTFFRSQGNFAETALPDGTTYYSHDVDADWGRQKQKILFATLRSRFLLATNEQLLLRALANIIGKGRHDALADEPAFRDLTRTFTPHTAAVWVDQAKLNDDWYFRHYWTMSETRELKNLRAGLFDWEMRTDKWVERREFLLTRQDSAGQTVPMNVANNLLHYLPSDMPYIHLQSLAVGQQPALLVRDALFDRVAQSAASALPRAYYYSDDELAEGEEGGYYDYLGEKYDRDISENDETDQSAVDAAFRQANDQADLARLSAALQPAQPVAAASAETLKMREAPLFAESQRITVLSMRSPDNLSLSALEEALAGMAHTRLILDGTKAQLNWNDHTENGLRWRVLSLPMLGWNLGYARRGAELLVTNNPEIFADSLNANNDSVPLNKSDWDEFTMVRLAQKQQVLDPLAAKLEPICWYPPGCAPAAVGEENVLTTVSGLLNVTSQVKLYTRTHSVTPGHLHEVVELSW